MNNKVSYALAAFLALGISGCASVLVEAPAGSPVMVASTGKTTTKKVSVRKWFMFWGIGGQASIAQDIQEAGFKVVRVVVRRDAVDGIMSFAGLAGIIPMSLTVDLYGE